MWRVGVLLVIAIVAAENNSAAPNKDGLIQRLKRSYYHEHSCFDPRPPPRPYWPPPPPPPFWPPPPPPRHQDDWGDSNAYSGASAQSAALSQAASRPAKLIAPNGQGCDSCSGNGKNSAVSNAQSNTGDAVAVAVSRASAH